MSLTYRSHQGQSQEPADLSPGDEGSVFLTSCPRPGVPGPLKTHCERSLNPDGGEPLSSPAPRSPEPERGAEGTRGRLLLGVEAASFPTDLGLLDSTPVPRVHYKNSKGNKLASDLEMHPLLPSTSATEPHSRDEHPPNRLGPGELPAGMIPHLGQEGGRLPASCAGSASHLRGSRPALGTRRLGKDGFRDRLTPWIPSPSLT